MGHRGHGGKTKYAFTVEIMKAVVSAFALEHISMFVIGLHFYHSTVPQQDRSSTKFGLLNK